MEVGENREMEKGQKGKTPWKRNHVKVVKELIKP